MDLIQPDWDNAPEGATHYRTEPIAYPWHKQKNGKWYFHGDSLGWVMYSTKCDLNETMKRLGVIEMPKAEDNTLDRHDALQWCLNNLKEFTALGIIGRGYPEGWTFTSDNGELLLCHTFHDPIKKVDFDMMTTPKTPEICKMQVYKNGKDGERVDIPSGATHILFEDGVYTLTFYKMDSSDRIEFYFDGEWEYWTEKGDQEAEGDFVKIEDAIIKDGSDMMATPKACIGDTPEQMRKGTTPWMPEVGEECNFFDVSAKYRVNWVRVIPLFFTDQVVVLQHCCSGNHFLMNLDEVKFRPLLTKEEIEREEGIKALTELVGECLSDEHLATAIWDAGYRKA